MASADHDLLLPDDGGTTGTEDDRSSSTVQDQDRGAQDRRRQRTCFSPDSNRFVFFSWFLMIGYYYSSRFKILELIDMPWAISLMQVGRSWSAAGHPITPLYSLLASLTPILYSICSMIII